jgi:hypothetical protein
MKEEGRRFVYVDLDSNSKRKSLREVEVLNPPLPFWSSPSPRRVN